MQGDEGQVAGPVAMPQQHEPLGGERVFPCVKLRGLPFDVNEEEIRVFLVSCGCGPMQRRGRGCPYWRLRPLSGPIGAG